MSRANVSFVLSWVFVCFFSIDVLSAINPLTICPPSHLIEPCKCRKDCKECNAQLLCQNLANQETLTHVLSESSDYQYHKLHLEKSSIMYVPASIFSIKKLSWIYIVNSSLVSVFDQAPSPDNALEVLYLFDVKLARGVQWETLSGLHKLEYMTFMHMPPMRKLDRVFSEHAPRNIENIHFYDCSISKIHDHAFSRLANLKKLHMQIGQVKELKRSMFPTPASLTYLDFHDNKIETLPADIFSNMPHLTHVRFSKNLITEVKQEVFGSVFPNLKLLMLQDNALICRCYIQWTFTTSTRMNPINFHGACATPKELEGRQLRTLNKEDFVHCG